MTLLAETGLTPSSSQVLKAVDSGEPIAFSQGDRDKLLDVFEQDLSGAVEALTELMDLKDNARDLIGPAIDVGSWPCPF